ncbi:outer membrane beta-barrel family protein [Chryseobacterium oryctis]|uniref:Outer membrane beta-barrel family protein n=1 Tax=Chryseobacterium oryctis TaxID=2952618 RepID=A0ABT3HPH8_9FLAO|nr:outer membrane beta-barrel family protein [Chryseobacterium oryctis]MCW3161654.1 outer membrane beta-barrel family protein [Chryseobacterium oryctis]
MNHIQNKLSRVLILLSSSIVILTSAQQKDTIKNEKKIEEVKITRSAVKFKNGKIIVSPSSTATGEANNTWEFIKNSGYADASEEGTIKIKQKYTTVYINDRKLRLSGLELKNYLESIPSKLIKNIEVIGTPDSSYSADEQAIIKINLINSSIEGLKLSIGSVLGFTKKMNMSQNLNLNYKSKKFEINTLLSGSHTNILTEVNSQREFRTNIWDITQEQDIKRSSNIYSFLVNYYANKKNKLSLYAEYNPANTQSKLYADNGLPILERISRKDSIFKYNSAFKDVGKSTNLQLNYKFENDSATQKLNVQIEYLNTNKKTNNSFKNYYYQAPEFIDGNQIDDVSSRSINMYIGNLNYTIQTKKLGIWSAGGRISYSDVNNPINITVNNLVSQESIQNYSEEQYALFLEGQKEFGKTYVRLGMRYESNITNFFDNNLKSNSFKIDGFYPNVLVQHNFSDDFQIESSYKKALIRPDYFLLNQLRRKNSDDSMLYTSGNINLRPQIEHEVDLSFYYKTQMLSVGMNYSPNYISTLIVKRGDYLVQEYNNFRLMTLYASLALNKVFKDKYIIKNYFNINYLPIIEYEGFEKGRTSLAVNNRTVLGIVLKNGYAAEASYSFSTDFYDGFFKHGATNNLSITIQKKIPHLNLTTYVIVSDLLRGQKNYDEAIYPIVYKNSSYSDTRGIKLGLYWTFGNQKLKEIKKDESLTNDLKNRNKK